MRSNVTRRGFFGTLAALFAWRPWRGTPTVWVNGGEWPTPTVKGKPVVWDDPVALEKAFTYAYDNCTKPGDPV